MLGNCAQKCKTITPVSLAAAASRKLPLQGIIAMNIELNGFVLRLEMSASQHGQWMSLPLGEKAQSTSIQHQGISVQLNLDYRSDSIGYSVNFTAPFRTRLRLRAELVDQQNLFHLIPGNIHGDNNAQLVRPGEFPCLAAPAGAARNRAVLWEFRADRASHPVSILCCERGAVGISIDPYSPCQDADDRFIRNGVWAALPNVMGVSLGYGNDPLTFQEKTVFLPATADLTRAAAASGTIYAERGGGRRAAHRIIRDLYGKMHDRPKHSKTHEQALRALAESFIEVNWSPQLQQYTNRACKVPVDRTLNPWRAIVEIGWTGGSVLAYPFVLARQIFPDLRFPKPGEKIFDEICTGYNAASGFINDAAINRFTQNRPEGWNDSQVNGWWSGFLPQTRGNHCAYTNAHAAYYLLAAPLAGDHPIWIETALRVLNSAVELQRADGAFGYIFSPGEKKVIDWDGFAGCWFAAALILAVKRTGEKRYRESAGRALEFYYPFVKSLAAWGTPMDTFKSIDSEGNLAFIRAARLMHQLSGEDRFLEMLRDGADYEYLWRYGFRTRPQAPPLKNSSWNSCGGSITSVSNPHIHPMSVIATEDLKYLARRSGDVYHDQRADDGLAWLMNTMELYPDVAGYGCYGVLSERTCPSDGLLAEKFYDDSSPASTWWSYNAWAAANAMEALAERILAGGEGKS